jgi:hypothetical protein
MSPSMHRRHWLTAGVSGQPGTQKSPHHRDCTSLTSIYCSSDNSIISQIHAQCISAPGLYVQMQPEFTTSHHHPHSSCATARPHAIAGVPSAASFSTTTNTIDRGACSVYLSNSVVFWVSILYRGSKPCFCFVYRSRCDAE